jgi:hypothetical protein
MPALPLSVFSVSVEPEAVEPEAAEAEAVAIAVELALAGPVAEEVPPDEPLLQPAVASARAASGRPKRSARDEVLPSMTNLPEGCGPIIDPHKVRHTGQHGPGADEVHRRASTAEPTAFEPTTFRSRSAATDSPLRYAAEQERHPDEGHDDAEDQILRMPRHRAAAHHAGTLECPQHADYEQDRSDDR